jgi:hypothetical protein
MRIRVLRTSTADEPAAGSQRRKIIVRRVGYLRGPAPDGMDCERPLLMAVSRDGRLFEREVWRCKNHRSSLCRPCAARYGRRVEAVAAHGLMLAGADFFHHLTITAPGAQAHCKKSGCAATDCAHEKCDCTPPGGVSLGEWNPTASKRWNHLLTLVERHYGERPQYFRAVECQDGKRVVDGCGRMALHFHVLLRTDCSVSERTLRKLAIQAGFGHELKLQQLAPGSRAAARYVAKYVTKSCDERDEVPWLVDQVDDDGEITAESRPATFRAWSQSKGWGTTMAAILVDVRRRWEKMDSLRAAAGHDQAANADRDEPPPDGQESLTRSTSHGINLSTTS